MAADRLASFEPAYVDELAILLRHAFDHMQQPDGSAVWLRLSTRQLASSPSARSTPAAVIAGAHWVVPPADGAPHRARLPGPGRARGRGRLRRPARGGAGRRPAGDHQPRPAARRLDSRRRARAPRRRRAAPSHIERMLAPLAPGAALVTVLDGHPASPCLARRRARPARHPARPRPFRPERRHSRSLPRIRPGRRRDPGRLRAGAAVDCSRE